MDELYNPLRPEMIAVKNFWLYTVGQTAAEAFEYGDEEFWKQPGAQVQAFHQNDSPGPL